MRQDVYAFYLGAYVAKLIDADVHSPKGGEDFAACLAAMALGALNAGAGDPPHKRPHVESAVLALVRSQTDAAVVP